MLKFTAISCVGLLFFSTSFGSDLQCAVEVEKADPKLIEEFNNFRSSFSSSELTLMEKTSQLYADAVKILKKNEEQIWNVEYELTKEMANLYQNGLSYDERQIKKFEIEKGAEEKLMALFTEKEKSLMEDAKSLLTQTTTVFSDKLKGKNTLSFGATDDVYCDNEYCYNPFYEISGIVPSTLSYFPGRPTLVRSLIDLLQSAEGNIRRRAYVEIIHENQSLFWDFLNSNACVIQPSRY